MEKEKVRADIIGNGYKAPGGKPVREDLRKKKKEDIRKKEMKDW